MAQLTARKTIYVNREIQGRIVSRLAQYWILYHVGLWSLLLIIELFHHMIAALLQGETFVLRDFGSQFVRDHWFFLAAPLVLFPAILWDMLHLTHKVAGPLVRYCRAFRDLAAGKTVERIELRKGDLLVEFQDAFNEYVESLPRGTGKVITPGLDVQSPSREDQILDTIASIGFKSPEAPRSLTAAVPMGR